MKFKPEDFYYDNDTQVSMTPFQASFTANEKLNKLIESWPVIFLTQTLLGNLTGQSVLQYPHQTHKARLAFIEDIVKEPCKHEPAGQPFTHVLYCKHCGVELVACWEEKK